MINDYFYIKKIDMKYTLSLLALFFVISFTTSCNSADKSNDKKKIEKIDKSTAKEYTSAYVCPMHCKGSGSSEMGTCPVCKMDYEKNEDYKGLEENDSHEGHDHGTDEGHDDDSHDGHNH